MISFFIICVSHYIRYHIAWWDSTRPCLVCELLYWIKRRGQFKIQNNNSYNLCIHVNQIIYNTLASKETSMYQVVCLEINLNLKSREAYYAKTSWILPAFFQNKFYLFTFFIFKIFFSAKNNFWDKINPSRWTLWDSVLTCVPASVYCLLCL